jgi:hypothetical protein
LFGKIIKCTDFLSPAALPLNSSSSWETEDTQALQIDMNYKRDKNPLFLGKLRELTTPTHYRQCWLTNETAAEGGGRSEGIDTY